MADTEAADVAEAKDTDSVVVTNRAAIPITAVTNITTKSVTTISTMCATNTATTSTITIITPAATHIAIIHVVVVATIAAVEVTEVETSVQLSLTPATWNHMCKVLLFLGSVHKIIYKS